ncbi:MAG: hypothetical protein G8345_08485 [Magnetococcales bacterium]|nr:hypothetical protein [Magnetococcales bacterium]NGZ26912.1 hypothetical protein [Magnetococcales bacterium]
MSALMLNHHPVTIPVTEKRSWVEFQGVTAMLASRRTRSLVSDGLVWTPAAVIAKIKAKLTRKA